MAKAHRASAGMSLIEVMAAVAVFAVVAVGSWGFFAHSKGFIQSQRRYREAVQLSAQRIEELKAASYDSIAPGQTQESLSLDGVPVQRTVTVAEDGSLKTVTVSVAWTHKDQQRQVALTTRIAPR